MKNKLLKIAAPLTMLAATAAPLTSLTSCNKEATPTLEIDLSKVSEWKPSTSKLTGEYTPDGMTNKYYEFVGANPLYMAEDIFNQMYSPTRSLTGTLKIWINNIDTTNKKVSFKMVEDAEEVTSSGTTKYDAVSEFVNIPYSATWDDKFVLACSWTSETILTAKDWRIYGKSGVSNEPVEYEYSDASTNEEKALALVWLQHVTIQSYYMSDCTLKSGK